MQFCNFWSLISLANFSSKFESSNFSWKFDYKLKPTRLQCVAVHKANFRLDSKDYPPCCKFKVVKLVTSKMRSRTNWYASKTFRKWMFKLIKLTLFEWCQISEVKAQPMSHQYGLSYRNRQFFFYLKVNSATIKTLIRRRILHLEICLAKSHYGGKNRPKPFFSRLQKVFSALGWKYYIMLTINFCILAIYFCTREDLEQNPILLLNSLMMCLKICEKFFWIIM